MKFRHRITKTDQVVENN